MDDLFDLYDRPMVTVKCVSVHPCRRVPGYALLMPEYAMFVALDLVTLSEDKGTVFFINVIHCSP